MKPRRRYYTYQGQRKQMPGWYGWVKKPNGKRGPVNLGEDYAAACELLKRWQKVSVVRELGLLPTEKPAPLADLLGQWEAYLKAKEDSPTHVRQQKQIVQDGLNALSWRLPADLDADALSTYLKRKRDASPAKPSKNNPTFGVTSSNYYLRTWKAFARWLHERDYLKKNPFLTLRPVPADPKRKRRSLSPADFKKLIDATAKSKRTYRTMGGKDRSLLYQVAAATGLRAGELSRLTRGHLQGDSLILPPKETKNRQGASQPLPAKLAKELRKRQGILFPGSWAWDCSRMLQKDLAEAGIPFKDHGKVFDFHALRGQFITGLARAGTPLQLAQKLARHSDPKLTSTVYTQWEEEEMRKAVEKAHG